MWEYTCVRVDVDGFNDSAVDAIKRTMNQYGSQGWELVSVAVRHPNNLCHILYFKRKR